MIQQSGSHIFIEEILKMDIHTNTSTEMFTAAVFLITPNCENIEQIVIDLYNEVLLNN